MADGSGASRWYTAALLAGMVGVPSTERNVREKADRESWVSRPREGRGGGK